METIADIPVPRAQAPAYIASLCDMVLSKRNRQDFHKLLQCLEQMPKECAPFKGKILHHLEIHGLKNSAADTKLLSACFAKATLLVKKTANKDEGPLGAWKNGLLVELRTLEENLNYLYLTVGINTSCIVEREEHDNDTPELLDVQTAWEDLVNEHLLKVNLAANNICALISVQTDFDIPIPVLILLRIASKIGLIRLPNHLKKPHSMLRAKCYTLYPHLIDINLMIFRTLIKVLSSNVIPFTPFIMQSLMKTLEWTRVGNLVKAGDIEQCYQIRTEILKTITLLMEQLSLNINIEQYQLKSLLETEILDYLEEHFASAEAQVYPVEADALSVESLICLKNLVLIYHDLLEASLENKVKKFIIQTCIKIYRDYDSNKLIRLGPRRQLLQVLSTLASQPYATSTTEIAYHIFELAEKLEKDPAIRALARKTLKVGLAHRPTVVSHYDVYNCYGLPMMTASDTDAAQVAQQQQQPPPPATRTATPPPLTLETHESSNELIEVDDDVVQVVEQVPQLEDARDGRQDNGIGQQQRQDEQGGPVEQNGRQEEEDGRQSEQDEQDEEVLLYMKDFVEKLA